MVENKNSSQETMHQISSKLEILIKHPKQ